jgi:glycine/D-amino acid oxidase-like deaminating enzyme
LSGSDGENRVVAHGHGRVGFGTATGAGVVFEGAE